MTQHPNDTIMANEQLLGNLDPNTAQLLREMKDALILILLARLGGTVEIPLQEMDHFPEGKQMTMLVDNVEKTFTFQVVSLDG